MAVEPKINFFIEETPFTYGRALTLKTGIDVGEEGEYNVYMGKDKALFALAFVAGFMGAEVFANGQKIEVEF